MLTTNDDRLADEARLLRDHAMSRTRKYWHKTIGYNYRLTNLQAAVGVAQLERIRTFLTKRAIVASQYNKYFERDDRIQMPEEAAWAKRVNWLYTVLLQEGIDRDHVIRSLGARDIDSRPVFYPVHHLPPYRTEGHFPVAESFSRRGISLPTSISLTERDIERTA